MTLSFFEKKAFFFAWRKHLHFLRIWCNPVQIKNISPSTQNLVVWNSAWIQTSLPAYRICSAFASYQAPVLVNFHDYINLLLWTTGYTVFRQNIAVPCFEQIIETYHQVKISFPEWCRISCDITVQFAASELYLFNNNLLMFICGASFCDWLGVTLQYYL